MILVICEIVLGSILEISFVEFRFCHWDLVFSLALLDIFFMKELTRHAYLLEFLVNVFIVRLTVHDLVHVFVRIEEAVRFFI